jgi:hypothetical protein
MEAAGKKDQGLAISLAGQVFGLNNALKNFEGSLKGLQRSGLLERKRADETAFSQSLEQHPEMKAKYGHLLSEFGAAYRDLKSYDMRQTILSGLINSSNAVQLVSFAVGRALDRERPEKDRSPQYADPVVNQVKAGIEGALKEGRPALDLQLVEMYLSQQGAYLKDQPIQTLENQFGHLSGDDRWRAGAEFFRKLILESPYTTVENVAKVFEMTAEQIRAQNDPILDFILEATEELDTLNRRQQRFNNAVTSLRPLFIRAMADWKKQVLYPDANRTLRFTYGQVQGYRPRDAVEFNYVTTLRGVLEKDTDLEPFDAPDSLRDLAVRRDFGAYVEPRLGDVPVAFLSSCDITGGNSGSPIMNGRGEMIGIVFDGNYEGLGSDYVFNPALSRAISVDIRYVLFVAEKFGGAAHLLRELQIKGKAASAGK